MSLHIQYQAISHNLAWRKITALNNNALPPNFIALIRFCCHQHPKTIQAQLAKLNIDLPIIRKFKKPFPLNLLPIPAPHYFYLHTQQLEHLIELANMFDQFLLLEVAILDEASARQHYATFLNSSETLCHILQQHTTDFKKFFACAFNFDDPHNPDDVGQLTLGNFVPPPLRLYFA